MLNLVSDPWIPVLRKDGTRAVIAPWQVADDSLAFPDWPRPDLNIACLELLVGLVLLADPPADPYDWEDRSAPDPERLRARLAPFAAAFELMGDGPRFLQDLQRLEDAGGEVLRPDFLFIDSFAGKDTSNGDLFVKRGRYSALEPGMAAMALYLLQGHAPPGGRGHRTSMRGGGPLVTLVDPGNGLWSIVWSNTPYGSMASPDVLPWMRDTRVSDIAGSETHELDAHPAEAFFGMPRRLRLIQREGWIVGAIQRTYGTNYSGWIHPLSPYSRKTATEPFRAQRARAGVFSYRNWLGTILAARNDSSGNLRRALVLDLWGQRSRSSANVIVGGWATRSGQFKILDFVFSRAPLIDLSADLAARIEGMVAAAEELAVALRSALGVVLAEGEAREAAREEFFLSTQGAFEARIALLAGDPDATARGWLEDLRKVARDIFDRHALPGLADRDTKDQAAIVTARRTLTASLAGHGKIGGRAFLALGLPVPERRRDSAA